MTSAVTAASAAGDGVNAMQTTEQQVETLRRERDGHAAAASATVSSYAAKVRAFVLVTTTCV